MNRVIEQLMRYKPDIPGIKTSTSTFGNGYYNLNISYYGELLSRINCYETSVTLMLREVHGGSTGIVVPTDATDEILFKFLDVTIFDSEYFTRQSTRMKLMEFLKE